MQGVTLPLLERGPPSTRCKLVALEYIVFKDAWEAAGHYGFTRP